MSNVAYTENLAISNKSALDPRLDLFFKCVRDLVQPPAVEGAVEKSDFEAPVENNQKLVELIDASFEMHPLDTMKILFNWRDSRGGKGDRHGFIVAMTYICEKHPAWFAQNVQFIPEFGRYLDLVHLWYLVKDKKVVMDAIVEQLLADMDNLKDDQKSVSLLAKWLPSENAKWDRFVAGHDRMCISLCKQLYGKGYIAKSDLRDFRKSYLSPLRKRINLVETLLCQKDYAGIQYEAVPSVAMKRYRKAFRKHDEERFQSFMDQVERGDKKINASQVFPHELVRHYLDGGSFDQVIEEQWRAIRQKVDESRAFEGSISVVDVSGSMSGVPMQVAIALGILSSNSSNDHSCLTFSSNPQLQKVDKKTLEANVRSLQRADWGMNTNIEKVFNHLLRMGKNGKRITKIFIFSDMQFDQAAQNSSQTHFAKAKSQFEDAGLVFPTMIFWNLRGDTGDFPVTRNEAGVIMLSGYSPSLLTAIVEGKDVTPLMILLNIINDPRYDCISAPVVDLAR